MKDLGGVILLTHEEMYHLTHPDIEVIKRRDRFFEEIDRTLDIQYLEDGSVIITAKIDGDIAQLGEQ